MGERDRMRKTQSPYLVSGAMSCASYLYRGLDRGETKESGKRKRRGTGGGGTKASAQLATSSLMKAVAAIQ